MARVLGEPVIGEKACNVRDLAAADVGLEVRNLGLDEAEVPQQRMAKGQNLKNFNYLGFFTDVDLIGGPLCEDFDFKFDVYAPPSKIGFSKSSRGEVDANDNYVEINGKYDAIEIFPGLHVEVLRSEKGENDFEKIATWNATGPSMADFKFEEDGASDGYVADYRGHQLIGDPYEGGTKGVAFLKYAVGNWSYEAAAGNEYAIQDLDGHGQIMDLADWFC